MKATKDGWTVEGTPSEIVELIALTQKAPGKRPEPKPETKKEIDWGKAEALKNAGWSFKAIGEELGLSYQTVYGHFRENDSK